MSTSYPFKPIVRDGLVLYLDATNSKSYPGSGSIWYDLSESHADISLSGTPNFDGKSFNFDGVDDYGVTTVDLTSGTNDFTVSVWATTNTTSGNKYLSDFGANGGAIAIGTDVSQSIRYYNATAGIGDGPGGTIDLVFDGPNIYDPLNSKYIGGINTWFNIVYSRSSGVGSIYANGINYVSASDGGNIGSWGTNFSIGRYGGGGYYWMGSISNVMVYKNKGLNQTEVLQNYNALKNRYTQW